MDAFEEEYGQPEGYFTMAIVDTRLASGVGLKMFRQEICEMKRHFVRREFRALGIGFQLCRSIVEKARTIGYTSIRLYTLERLKKANRLYTWMEFEKILHIASIQIQVPDSLSTYWNVHRKCNGHVDPFRDHRPSSIKWLFNWIVISVVYQWYLH